MTAILAYREGRSSWIGGDGEVSDGATRHASPDPKVWRPRPGLLVGACGGIGWCDAVAWIDWPRELDDAWIRRSLPTVICRGLSESQTEEGCAIVVSGGRIYIVEAAGAYVVRDAWVGIGSGGREATAACAAAAHLSGAKRVRAALEIAGRYAVGVGPPYLVLRA